MDLIQLISDVIYSTDPWIRNVIALFLGGLLIYWLWKTISISTNKIESSFKKEEEYIENLKDIYKIKDSYYIMWEKYDQAIIMVKTLETISAKFKKLIENKLKDYEVTDDAIEFISFILSSYRMASLKS